MGEVRLSKDWERDVLRNASAANTSLLSYAKEKEPRPALNTCTLANANRHTSGRWQKSEAR